MICRPSAAVGALVLVATPVVAEKGPGQTLSSHRSVAAIRQCFIASQDNVPRPWAFVPDEKGDGGRFSTVPGSDTYSPYSLTIRSAGTGSRLALEGDMPPASGPMIATAVDGCLAVPPTALARAR
jgi:hypothetical protein